MYMQTEAIFTSHFTFNQYYHRLLITAHLSLMADRAHLAVLCPSLHNKVVLKQVVAGARLQLLQNE